MFDTSGEKLCFSSTNRQMIILVHHCNQLRCAHSLIFHLSNSSLRQEIDHHPVDLVGPVRYFCHFLVNITSDFFLCNAPGEKCKSSCIVQPRNHAFFTCDVLKCIHSFNRGILSCGWMDGWISDRV